MYREAYMRLGWSVLCRGFEHHIDFMYGRSSLTVFYFHELTFVGVGLYEFHIEVPQFGEWNIMTQNSLFIGD